MPEDRDVIRGDGRVDVLAMGILAEREGAGAILVDEFDEGIFLSDLTMLGVLCGERTPRSTLEPPVGIEPTTCSLRVNRSAD
jgi:hypothetical protein